MSFKNKIFSKVPGKYISYKIKDKAKASEIKRGYKAIRKNNLFDDEFYLEKYPKVASSGMDPLLHYIFFGLMKAKSLMIALMVFFIKITIRMLILILWFIMLCMELGRIVKLKFKTRGYLSFLMRIKEIFFLFCMKRLALLAAQGF